MGKKIEQRNKTKNTSSKRSLDLIPEIKELLLGLKAKQDENKKLFKGSYIESDYVFTWKGGKLFRPDYLTKAFQTKLEKSNFKKMRFHDLHRSCATLLNEKGMSEFDIQMWLGHANIQTTKKYTHITKKLQNSIAQNLAGSFSFSL